GPAEAPPKNQGPSAVRPKPGGLMTQAEVLADLFKRYQRLRTQHKAYLAQRKAANARVSDVTKSLAEITAEYRQDKQAVERVLKAAKTVRAAAARVLAMPPPRRPRLQSLPSRPNPAFYESAFAYDLALENWARDCARIRQNNELLIQEYEASLRRYEARRRQAASDLRAANAKVAECEQALADLLKARQSAQTPLKTERHDLTEGTRDADAEARKLVRNLEATTEAIRGIPEKIRLEHGVLEWQNEFYSLAEIEQIHGALLQETKAVRDGADAGTEPGTDPAARSSSRPKRAEADALKRLIEKAKAAQARSVPR
ncbi:MAG: hypothetical protein R6X20_14985, partial [Phycisphaerae bacterium]